MLTCTRFWRDAVSSAFSLDKVFIINLARRTDRWAAIQEVCQRAGLPADKIERVAAVEGSSVDVEAAHHCGFVSRLGLRRLREPPAHQIWGMDLNAGALGCALSHIQLWSHVACLERCEIDSVKGGTKQCFLILEDDATLVEHASGASSPSASTTITPFGIMEQLQRRMQCVPSDWELVYIAGLDTANQCPHLRVSKGVAHVPQYHRTTSAYLLTPRGARRLLATCVPLTFQLDTVMTMNVGLPAGVVPGPQKLPYVLDPICYTLQPPLMEQAAQLGTDIQQPRL